MKCIIIGDLHCRPIWKDIVEKESDSDKIIFLGDYTCPREVKLDDPTDACGFLYEILDFKDKNPDKVILLRGNHCLDSLGYHWAECYPQDHPFVKHYWQTEDVKNWYLKNTQWVYNIPKTDIVCSHAGVSEEFLKNVNEYYRQHINSDKNIYHGIMDINDIEPCELFGFTPCKLSDYYGDSATQPCTWIRPYTLLDHGVRHVIHVVGHTPVEHICNLKEEALKQPDINKEIVNNYCDVWCCDCLANREYLIIENEEFKPCKI